MFPPSPPIDCVKPIPNIHFDIWSHMLASTLYFTLYLLTHSSAHASPSLLCGPPSYLQRHQARSPGSHRWSSLPLLVVQARIPLVLLSSPVVGVPRRDPATSVPSHSCQWAVVAMSPARSSCPGAPIPSGRICVVGDLASPIRHWKRAPTTTNHRIGETSPSPAFEVEGFALWVIT